MTETKEPVTNGADTAVRVTEALPPRSSASILQELLQEPNAHSRSKLDMVGAGYSVATFALAAMVNALIVTLICSVALLHDSHRPDYVEALGFVFVASLIITLSGLAVARGVGRAGDALDRRLERARRRRRGRARV